VDAKRAPVILGLSRVQSGNYGNQFIVVWQLKPYLCNSESRSWTPCLTSVTMVDDLTMEFNICSICI
jgi:hypothetical protein